MPLQDNASIKPPSNRTPQQLGTKRVAMGKTSTAAPAKSSNSGSDPQPSGAQETINDSLSTLDRLRGIVALITEGVKQKDTRMMMGRILRETASRRAELTVNVLRAFLEETLPTGSEAKAVMIDRLGQVRLVLVTTYQIGQL